MDDVTAMIIVAISVGGCFWLIAQVLKHRAAAKIPPAEAAMLEQINRIAQRMEGRMNAVERILDAEAPAWRGQSAGGSDERRFG